MNANEARIQKIDLI